MSSCNKKDVIWRIVWRCNIQLLDHSAFRNRRSVSIACIYCNQRRDICEQDGDFLNTFPFFTPFKNDLKLCNFLSLTSFDINCDTISFSPCSLEGRSGHWDWKIVSILRASTFETINSVNVPYNKIWALVPGDISRYSRCPCVIFSATNWNMHSRCYCKIVVFYSTDFIDTISIFLKNDTGSWQIGLILGLFIVLSYCNFTMSLLLLISEGTMEAYLHIKH